MNGKEFESINIMRMCENETNKHRETSSTYINEGKENNSSTSENKEKECDGYVFMYECGKKICH